MKKNIIILSLISATIGTVAQNTDDALQLSMQRPSGTARSMSLGNAMGALGGDYTSIGINPAGIAVYRSSEFTFTPSLHLNQTESNYYDTNTKDDKLYMPLQQIGFVGTYKPMHETSSGLVSTHFSVGYTRNNNFKKSTFMQGNEIQSSLLDEFVYMGDNINPLYLDMRTGLAYDAFLIDPLDPAADDDGSISTGYFHGFEEIDNNGDVIWGPENGIYQNRLLKESGNSGDVDVAFGANFNNKFYLGGSLGISTFHYRKTMQHYEKPEPSQNPWTHLKHYTFEDKQTTNGLGVNLKLGVIFRPLHALRLGASFHTPTLYAVDEEYSSSVYLPSGFADYQIYDSPLGEYSYNFRTPYKAIGSLAYTFGSKGLISADYEFTDYSSMKFASSENTISDMNFIENQNNQIKEVFRGTHNIRLGAEFRPTEIITVRAGYGLFQSPYKSGYINHDDKHQTFSAGLGFKMNNMFVDLAYMLRQQKNAYSLYYSPIVEDENPGLAFQEPANLTSNLHQVAVTLGWRF